MKTHKKHGKISDLTRILCLKNHELPEAHHHIKDQNMGKIRYCQSTGEPMEATKACHMEWMNESPPKNTMPLWRNII